MYKTINGWTKAKMIKQVLKKNNGTKCVDYNQDCQYWGENNNHCFVGAFIPEELYNITMEDMNADSLLEDFSNLSDYMPIETRGLHEFQQIHDMSSDKDVHELATKWINENVKDSNER